MKTRVLGGAVPFLVAWAAMSCQQAAQERGPRPTPAPPFGRFEEGSPSARVAYAASLRFDSVRGAADEQRLVTDTTCDSPRALRATEARERARVMGIAKAARLADSTLLTACTVGPRVRVEPESGAYLIGPAGLRTGRIIARLVNLDSIPYPKLNLQPLGTTYWWVDSAGPGGYRSAYVPADTTAPVKWDTLVYHLEKDVRWRQALARFEVVEQDDKLWTACDSLGCCRSFK